MKITHVLVFQGEMPQTLLCTSLDDAKAKVAEAFQFGDEEKELFDAELIDENSWAFDESERPFHFSTDIGEIETVHIYVVTEQVDESSTWKEINKR